MSDTQNYLAEIHIRTTSGELVTTYHYGPGPVRMSNEEMRARIEKAALAEVPDGKVQGYRVHPCDCGSPTSADCGFRH
jgi:hypothetical protein